MSGKVASAIILAFVISFSIFVYVQSSIYNKSDTEADFYSEKFDDSKSKVLLIGSNYVGMLNATVIESILEKKNPEIQVFNLSTPGDKPEDRIIEIEKILELEPEIVAYGWDTEHFPVSFL